MIEIPWTGFKAFVTSKSLRMQYVDLSDTYFLFAFDGHFAVECKIYKDSGADQTDFETNYQAGCNLTLDVKDSDGATFSTNKACPAGWSFQKRYIELQTSNLTSIVNNNYDGTSWSDATIKCYNAGGTELTNQGDCDTDCVKTVFSWEPTYNYSIIGGGVYSPTVASTNVYSWLVAVPDVPALYGGCKVMVNQMNAKNEQRVYVDGRTGKILTYSATYHTNKLQLIIKHDAGLKHDMTLNLEHFKP